MFKFIKKDSDSSWDVLKCVKSIAYSSEVLKFVTISSQKCWVYNNAWEKVIKRQGNMAEESLKYCVLRGSFFEKPDSLIQNQGSMLHGARADLKGYDLRPFSETV